MSKRTKNNSRPERSICEQFGRIYEINFVYTRIVRNREQKA